MYKDISSIQWLSHVRLFDTPKMQPTIPIYSSPTPRIYPNSCSLSQ